MSLTATTDADVLTARRAVSAAGEVLAAGKIATSRRRVVCAWHAPTAHPETGAACLVGDGGAQSDLVGKVLRVTLAGRAVTVLCVAREDPETLGADLSLTRAAWLKLAPAAASPAEMIVEVLE